MQLHIEKSNKKFHSFCQDVTKTSHFGSRLPGAKKSPPGNIVLLRNFLKKIILPTIDLYPIIMLGF